MYKYIKEQLSFFALFDGQYNVKPYAIKKKNLLVFLCIDMMLVETVSNKKSEKK